MYFIYGTFKKNLKFNFDHKFLPKRNSQNCFSEAIIQYVLLNTQNPPTIFSYFTKLKTKFGKRLNVMQFTSHQLILFLDAYLLLHFWYAS